MNAAEDREIEDSKARPQQEKQFLTSRSVCHKCAVRFEPLCAKVRLFDTFEKCFRAGLFRGKSLI
jgi:hypothetical protein